MLTDKASWTLRVSRGHVAFNFIGEVSCGVEEVAVIALDKPNLQQLAP